jgi:hypothetical protein
MRTFFSLQKDSHFLKRIFFSLSLRNFRDLCLFVLCMFCLYHGPNYLSNSFTLSLSLSLSS